MIAHLGTQPVDVISGINTSAVLPSGFLELEYVESTGSQSLDPNVSITADIGFEVTINVNTDSNGVIIGSYIPGTSNYMLYSYTNGNMSFFNGLNNPTISLTVPRLTKGTIKVQNGVLTNSFDNNTYNLSGTISSEIGQTLYLFSGRPYSASNPFFSSYKLYRCKIFNGNTTIRDFIPCYRISDGAVGLYDIIGSQFYTHEGTSALIRGDFVAIPVEYQEIDIGTLNWAYATSSQFFFCELSNMKKHATNEVPDLHLAGYTTRLAVGADGVANIDAQDMGISSETRTEPGRLLIKNKSYNNAYAFKQASAGQILTYAVEIPDIKYPKNRFKINIKNV